MKGSALKDASSVATTYDLPLHIAEKALANIASGEVCFLTVSGKIGAGKDTIAPLVMERLGYPEAIHESFASPLRDEVNQVIELIREATNEAEAHELTAVRMGAVNHAEVISALYEAVKSGQVTSSYQRTAETRRALQWWGTEVRRAVDPDYWVRKALQQSLRRLADGVSIYVTDSRFPNEASAITDVSGLLLRLYVSPEEQRRRILARDGIEPNEQAINHVSETAMDSYAFPLVVNTDGNSVEEVLEQAIVGLEKQRSKLAV